MTPGRSTVAADVEAAKELLQGRGYVVLKTKHYEAAQQRMRQQHDAGMWMARSLLAEVRQLRENVTVLRRIAMARGATVEELSEIREFVLTLD